MKLFIRVAVVLGLVFLAVIALGIYRFNFTEDDLYVRENDMVRPLAEFDGGAKGVMKRLFSLDTREQFRIRLPDSNKSVTLTGFKEEQHLAFGEYLDEVVRGEVLLDYRKLTPLNLPGNAESMQFVVPFAVTTQGSGVFWYLGMFRFDYQTGAIAHLASQFLGDRIEIEAITPKEPFDPPYSVTLALKTRTQEQSMAEAPGEYVERTFFVTLNSILPSSSQ
ncbi:hypothetical protein [Shewanella algae]|uniref:hypothetical protein n=1 Tax=Shewanella algae TaxID=38313 RepID=UPI00313A9675